jgi:hypothetical protein
MQLQGQAPTAATCLGVQTRPHLLQGPYTVLATGSIPSQWVHATLTAACSPLPLVASRQL